MNRYKFVWLKKQFCLFCFMESCKIFIYRAFYLIIFILSSINAPALNPDSLINLLPQFSVERKLESLQLISKELSEDNPSRSLLYCKEALSLARSLGNRRQEAMALRTMADATYYLQDYNSALELYISSARVLKNSGDIENQDYISLVSDIGYCYLVLDKLGEALLYFSEALELSQQQNLPEEIASNYNNLANIYIKWGDYKTAADYYQKAMQIDRENGNMAYISTSLNNLGKVYEHWGKFDQAISYYREAYIIDSVAGNRARIAIRLNNMAVVYKSKGNYQKALQYFEKALEIERALGNNENVGRRLAYIGETWLDLKEYNIAKSYFHQALPLLESGRLTHDLARLYNIMATYEMAINNYNKALEMLQKSQHLAITNGLKPQIINNYRVFYEIYEKSGKPDLALEYFKKYIELRDSVFSVEGEKKLAEFQARYENEKVIQENVRLKSDGYLQKKNKEILFFTLITILLISIAVFIMLRYRNMAMKQQKLIAEQQANSVIKDLELKNNELTYNAMCIIKTNEVISRMTDTIKLAINENESTDRLKEVLNELKSLKNEQAWSEFEVRFTQVHNDFYNRLQETFPDLSPNEKKLCAFLRLNMTTKDIAAITHQSVHSINVARTRLRKKMNLSNSDENLVNFLMNL
jgi:tetratricopeptide (TPR) repeat protein